MISLFTGAGGLDLGAGAAGCVPAVCIEIDPDSVATLRRNSHFNESPILGDLTELTSEQILTAARLRVGEGALLIGGPPCQPFSKAGYWTSTGEEARRREMLRARSNASADTFSRADSNERVARGRPRHVLSDARSGLIHEFARVLEETRPAGFVFENVVSITHPSSRAIFASFLQRCQDAGYATRVYQANAAQFGVPQQRKRVFVMGLRGRVLPEEPRPTHALPSEAATGRLPPPVSANAVIWAYASGDYAEPDEIVAGRWAEHLREVPPGSNYKALTAWAGHPNPTFEAEKRFWNFLLKLHPDRPSWTIAANPGPWVGPFHWDSRRLRVPELAALQAFPDGYQFAGSKRSIRRQIGNAVPPLLAQHVIETTLAPILGERVGTRSRTLTLVGLL